MGASLGSRDDSALPALRGLVPRLLGAQGLGRAGVSLYLGEEVGAILLFGDGAHALELLFHGHGAERGVWVCRILDGLLGG